ncbi:hypothetical protein CLOM_g9818 [Closterium sp. NIES-68]|nr:hypothetical protein CLOM_g9818 [Closterium sp. NIES-68]
MWQQQLSDTREWAARCVEDSCLFHYRRELLCALLRSTSSHSSSSSSSSSVSCASSTTSISNATTSTRNGTFSTSTSATSTSTRTSTNANTSADTNTIGSGKSPSPSPSASSSAVTHAASYVQSGHTHVHSAASPVQSAVSLSLLSGIWLEEWCCLLSLIHRYPNREALWTHRRFLALFWCCHLSPPDWLSPQHLLKQQQQQQQQQQQRGNGRGGTGAGLVVMERGNLEEKEEGVVDRRGKGGDGEGSGKGVEGGQDGEDTWKKAVQGVEVKCCEEMDREVREVVRGGEGSRSSREIEQGVGDSACGDARECLDAAASGSGSGSGGGGGSSSSATDEERRRGEELRLSYCLWMLKQLMQRTVPIRTTCVTQTTTTTSATSSSSTDPSAEDNSHGISVRTVVTCTFPTRSSTTGVALCTPLRTTEVTTTTRRSSGGSSSSSSSRWGKPRTCTVQLGSLDNAAAAAAGNTAATAAPTARVVTISNPDVFGLEAELNTTGSQISSHASQAPCTGNTSSGTGSKAAGAAAGVAGREWFECCIRRRQHLLSLLSAICPWRAAMWSEL